MFSYARSVVVENDLKFCEKRFRLRRGMRNDHSNYICGADVKNNVLPLRKASDAGSDSDVGPMTFRIDTRDGLSCRNS